MLVLIHVLIFSTFGFFMRGIRVTFYHAKKSYINKVWLDLKKGIRKVYLTEPHLAHERHLNTFRLLQRQQCTLNMSLVVVVFTFAAALTTLAPL